MKQYKRTEAEWKAYLHEHNIELIDYDCPTTKSTAMLTFQCLTCGTEETVRADNLARRRNTPCQTCANYQRYTTASIKALIEQHGGSYISGDVTGKMSTVHLRCQCGAVTVKSAHDIRRRPSSCKHCRNQQISITQLRNNRNRERALAIAEERGGKCLTEEQMFSTRESLSWQCSQGHQWHANLDSVATQGTWCPSCQSNIAENMVRAIFEATYQRPFPVSRPDFLATSGSSLHLDGYNKELGLAFECQGSQHYQKNNRFHKSREDLYAQMERDALKAVRCQTNLVMLVTVPYSVTDKGLEETRNFLAKMLMETGIMALHDPRDVKIDPRKIYDTYADAPFLDFKKIVADKGGSFESHDYAGLTKPLSVRCENGHRFQALPYLVRNGHWCPECAGNKRLTLDHITEQLQQEGWSLADPEQLSYTNAHQPLEMFCQHGHLVTRTWNKWQQGKRTCSECQRLDRAHEFVDKMKQRGIDMDVNLSTYQGERQPVRGICRHCGQETTLPVEQWKNRSLTPCCSKPLPAYHRCHLKTQESCPT
ncbi:hypothetical protein SAMN05660420_01805 [Desulfuromusa kysingii]|uniref:Zinc-ribbon domain-containing protein n=1 Tax=Desulfuromusa kysingii TaxID=37625 RepID=A0A1H4AEK7_9BACT|nr:hypothetical protein [Desulfuromusa kysingii]SEA34429.1 hypothetical protein SAMN05660420_01805 [Desulfuromusa kysingii]